VDLKLQKIGKRKIKVLVALLSLSIILSSSLTPMAYGTIEKEYEYSEIKLYPYPTLLYRFKVKVIIETENDGTWIPSCTEHWYRIDYIITLDYINKTTIESLIFFYHFSIPISGLTYISFRDIKNKTEVMEYSGQTDMLSFEITAYPQEFIPRLRIRPQFEFNYTFTEDGRSYSTQWCGLEPIYVDKKEPLQVSESPSIVVTGTVIGVIIGVAIGTGSVLLGIKIGEKRAEKKKG